MRACVAGPNLRKCPRHRPIPKPSARASPRATMILARDPGPFPPAPVEIRAHRSRRARAPYCTAKYNPWLELNTPSSVHPTGFAQMYCATTAVPENEPGNGISISVYPLSSEPSGIKM